MRLRRRTVRLALPVLVLVACQNEPLTGALAMRGTPSADRAPVDASGTQTVVGSALLYPRGLTFDQSGAIVVAEAGTPAGHTLSTAGLCQQVPGAPGPGPDLGGFTGRISTIVGGVRETLVSGLPSSLVTGQRHVIGVGDVAFVGRTLYALLNGGCSHGLLDVPSSIVRIEPDGSWTTVADLSAWLLANPAAEPDATDFTPDGQWYGLAAAGGILYAVDANGGVVVSVHPSTGRIERLVDVSAIRGHVVPSALAVSRSEILVGLLTTIPAVSGGAEVLRFSRDGQLTGSIGGFTAILGLDVDRRGNLYVLESFTCGGAPACTPSPGTARVVRVAPDGTRRVVATGLSLATALRIGPDDTLYVANWGYGPPGMGQVVRVVP
jgi:hypothetical protein